MCLVSNNNIPRLALKDIKAYKIIKEVDSQYWEAPFIGTSHKYNILLREPISKITLGKSFFNTIVGPGFFHSFIHNKEAIELQCRLIYNPHRSLKDIITTHYLLKEVIIPKGSLYFIGEYGDICSNQLIVKY